MPTRTVPTEITCWCSSSHRLIFGLLRLYPRFWPRYLVSFRVLSVESTPIFSSFNYVHSCKFAFYRYSASWSYRLGISPVVVNILISKAIFCWVSILVNLYVALHVALNLQCRLSPTLCGTTFIMMITPEIFINITIEADAAARVPRLQSILSCFHNFGSST